MSSGQFRTLKKLFEELLGREKLGAKHKEKLVNDIFTLYESLGRDATRQEHEEVYELFDLSTHIFKAANQEVVDNDAKWTKEKGKENKGHCKFKTKLFELSIYHLKNCCQRNLDHNNVPWIQYSLAVLQKPWILSEVSMESELSTCLLSCANASHLHWAQHHHLKKLWEFIWSRIEHESLEMSILKNYVELAVKMMKGVEVNVFETSPFHVVRTVLLSLKAVATKADYKFWTHSRKYSFVHILSYVVHRWGLEARDLILREVFHIIDNLTSLISVEQSGIEDSKTFMMRLTDDLVKLAMVEKIGSHRTIDEKTEEQLKDLLRTSITDALKSAHGIFVNKVHFSISEENVRYISRWILAARDLDPPPTPDHSFEMECSKTKKKDVFKSFSYEDLVDLSFGANIPQNANKCNAWSGAVQILNEVIASRKIDAEEIGRIVASLWSKRKTFSTDALRVTFCSLLASTISEDVKFGCKQIPSIDLLLKYALSLMSNVTSLPNSAHLVERILRFRSSEVPKEMLRVITDTVSRTHPSSIAVVRLISAFISYTEFDEDSRFCSINDEPKGSWSLRKDIVDWLLADPNANCHKLIYQLCQYHPIFCFDLQKQPRDDSLLQNLKRCGLQLDPALRSEPHFRPLEVEIGEMISYVKGELQCILASDLTLPSFIISYEFSLKSSETSIDLSNIYPRMQSICEGLDLSTFRESVEQFTVWPEKFPLPRDSLELLIVFLLSGLDNQLLNLNPWLDRKEELVESFAEQATRRPLLRSSLQKAMPFNQFVKKHILDNLGDLYETTKKFDRFSHLLSHRNMLSTRELIKKEAENQLAAGDSIYEADVGLFENMIASACIRNASGGNLIGGFDLDPAAVASYPDHVCFNDRSIIKYLKELKQSPFLAQNIVRHVLKSTRMWHLQATVLKFVMKNEKLLSVCIATIPNMIRFLRIYQIHFDPKSEVARFLTLDTESMRKCQKYLRKPRKNGESIDPDDLIILFGTELKRWRTPIFRFWRLFEKDPATIGEKLHEFANKSVKLGLTHRLVCLLRAISTSELSRSVLLDPHLRTVYKLIYRSVFSIVIRKECSPEIIEMCCDERLKYDVFQHRIKKVPAPHLDEFMAFETEIAFSVEKFLQKGIASDSFDFNDLGLVEFYRQLNENLSEDVIRHNDARDMYLVDFLSSMWQLLPAVRPQIVPIVARFQHISPAWSHFPQPPHVTSNEHSFVWRLRFSLAMKVIAGGSWKQGELSTCTSLLLNSFDPCRFPYRTDLIPPNQLSRLKENTKRDVLCILSRILRVEAFSEENEATQEQGKEWKVFDSTALAASIFRDIAACTVPFLFKICVDFRMKYDFSLGKLLACLKGVNKEDVQVVYCLAECVDSLGLNVLARYERLDDTDPSTSSNWFFVLSRLFLKHGFLTHAFAVANIIFDRLSRHQRNVMMIERVTLDSVEKSKEIVELLVEIYVAEGNSVALASLPPSVQTRPDVRQVMQKKAKEWLRLVSSGLLDNQELTVIRWMCGLPSEDTEKYLDSVLRGHFADYPKHIDTPRKFVYFLLFHLAVETDISSVISEIMVQMSGSLKIEDVRLLMLASGEANFEPQTVEEHVVLAVRILRETTGKRQRMESQFAREVNEKTVQIMKVAAILVENKAFEAASRLMSQWKDECVAWSSQFVDVALVEVCQFDIMCQAGDTRMAEINLRSMLPRVGQMSDVAVAEWTLALSNITFDFRNNVDEGIRLLEKGCRRLQSRESIEARLKVLLKFHAVCVNQLSKLEEYRESRSFRMKQQAISVFEKQISNSRVVRGGSGDDNRTVQRVRREHQCEKDDVAKVENSVTTAVLKAVSSAFDALDCISQLEDDSEALRAASLIIFPLIDVIYKYEQLPEVANLLKEHVATKLTSKFWLCATSHITSKCFSVEPSPLQRSLYQILCRLICDYPYHVLHTILMYEYEQNASKVRNFLNSVLTKAPGRDLAKLKEIVESMKEAHFAYRELARLDTKENTRLQRVQVDGKTMLRMPSELRIFKCKLQSLPIPTITQKIGQPGDYTTNGLVTWKSWKGVFSIADGLSAPKIWEIQGSDGKWYRTVWKKDDVRQDVLVEQMFDVTNSMLEKQMLRTYNVVPLDTECGIIEFCGGTVSIKELLCGVSRDKGLHSEFNPGEPSASKVSMKMRGCQNESTETRCRVFVEICREYSPVFRHFFYTKFSTAHVWRDKIVEYRRSLATWSVVCYIVGLGDRHASNILFDQKLCTFVHIDLGMILEYSKRTLPVPEQVPFRISRDLLDPILIEGIENGQLAEECTEIIEKLKQNGKVILGVASALLRETMTNFRETEQASGRPSYISEMAIGRLRDKLGGTDDGITAQSSSLQVRRLLREATNADNLSRMFCGWMPFL